MTGSKVGHDSSPFEFGSGLQRAEILPSHLLFYFNILFPRNPLFNFLVLASFIKTFHLFFLQFFLPSLQFPPLVLFLLFATT